MFELGLSATVPRSFSVFADESKPDGNCPWLVIGLLLLDDARRDEALMSLRASRNRLGYQDEIHFVEVRNLSTSLHGAKTGVAIDWLRHVVHDQKKLWNLHVVAIKGSMLDHQRFGEGADDNIYARFFRSALRYGIKASARSSRISRIFHDDSHLERHEYFPWHAISRLHAEDGIGFGCQNVEFISSNHRAEDHPYPWAAELIQLVDVWLGCFRQILAMPSSNKGRMETVEHGCDFIRVLNEPNHACRPLKGKACEYDHRGRCSVGFFPDGKLAPSELPDITGPQALNYFYLGERLAYFDDAQQSLF